MSICIPPTVRLRTKTLAQGLLLVAAAASGSCASEEEGAAATGGTGAQGGAAAQPGEMLPMAPQAGAPADVIPPPAGGAGNASGGSAPVGIPNNVGGTAAPSAEPATPPGVSPPAVVPPPAVVNPPGVNTPPAPVSGGAPALGPLDPLPASNNTALPKHWHESGAFGTDTKAGLDGTVYKVTNLNASGSGSLKDAVSGGNRLVVFEVGGVIDLDGGSIGIGSDNVMVAGHTAPSPGITIVRGGLHATGDNIVVSHLSVQLGADTGGWKDASSIRGTNTVFDHLAVYWGMDETLNVHGGSNASFYKCIVAEGLQYTGHKDGEHSKGSFINGNPERLSLVGNLYAHNALRNPRVDDGEVFIANDVVYNWASGWDHQGPKWSPGMEPNEFAFTVVVSGRTNTKFTFVGNVGISGPESVGQYFLSGHNATTSGYEEDNIIIDQMGNPLTVMNTDVTVLDAPPIYPEGVVPLPAHEAAYNTLRTVGPRPGDRDRHAARIVQSVAEGNGEVIDSQDEVGGYADYPETKHSLTVPDGAEARQAWLDELEDAIAVDRTLNLSRLYPLIGSEASDTLR